MIIQTNNNYIYLHCLCTFIFIISIEYWKQRYYLLKQCAAVITHCGDINTPPHATADIPFFNIAVCHGQSPNLFFRRVPSSDFSLNMELPHPSEEESNPVVFKHVRGTSSRGRADVMLSIKCFCQVAFFLTKLYLAENSHNGDNRSCKIVVCSTMH